MASPTKRSSHIRRRKAATCGRPRKAAIRKALRKARAQKIDVL